MSCSPSFLQKSAKVSKTYLRWDALKRVPKSSGAFNISIILDITITSTQSFWKNCQLFGNFFTVTSWNVDGEVVSEQIKTLLYLLFFLSNSSKFNRWKFQIKSPSGSGDDNKI